MHDASKKQAAAQRVNGFRFSPARISKGSPSRRISDREIFYPDPLEAEQTGRLSRKSLQKKRETYGLGHYHPGSPGDVSHDPGKSAAKPRKHTLCYYLAGKSGF
jgi:hypothetical protein